MKMNRGSPSIIPTYILWESRKGEEGEKGVKRISEEIMDKNFPYLVKNINLHIQEAQQIPRRVKFKTPTLIQIIMELMKVKGRILKAASEKQLFTYKNFLNKINS